MVFLTLIDSITHYSTYLVVLSIANAAVEILLSKDAEFANFIASLEPTNICRILLSRIALKPTQV